MKTVLIIDDSKADRHLMKGLLKGSGIQVATAGTGQEALDWLATNKHPHLIIMDIVMPDVSGLDLCRQIRTQPQFESIPIVFCSQKDQEFDRFWALRQGANAYLVKPYSPNDLMKTVQDLL